MLELKKKIISTYLEFAEKCQCESCVDCLYADAPLPMCEALLLADLLVSSGLFTSPAIPGPSESDTNIMELCFHNGERHMKEKICMELTKIAEKMPCITVAQAIALLEGL